jgi:hypothetical protein
MRIYQRTGQWPDGAQIVKEFSTVQVGEGCDPKSALCDTALGAGIFQSGYVGLGLMVKDARRFPTAPGHWGYFSFGHQPQPYAARAALSPQSQCSDCHVRLASATGYVVSVAHIGLRAEQ